jgi:hypothetical protein
VVAAGPAARGASVSEERIVALRRIPQPREDRPSWVQKVGDWLSRHAVPFGTVHAQMTVEYQHGQPVLIRLRLTATEEIITIDPTRRAQRDEITDR